MKKNASRNPGKRFSEDARIAATQASGDGEAFTAGTAASFHDFLAGARLHAGTETVGLCAFTLFRLVGSF